MKMFLNPLADIFPFFKYILKFLKIQKISCHFASHVTLLGLVLESFHLIHIFLHVQNSNNNVHVLVCILKQEICEIFCISVNYERAHFNKQPQEPYLVEESDGLGSRPLASGCF